METNEKLVLDTWNAFLRGDIKAAFANLADDATWTLPGLSELAGVHRGKDAILVFLRTVAQAFPKGLRSEIRKVHSTPSAVIVELTNRSETAAGRPYENEYCFVFDVEGGKIRAIREYVDTEKAAAILAQV
jgi:hypothetical protein